MKSVFEKYGILMEDVTTGLPRIKLYKDEQGGNKGDALVTYFKEESVELAVNLLDESDFRVGEGWPISVQQAVFKEKEKPLAAEGGEGTAGPKANVGANANKAGLSKAEKKKLQKKYQKLEK
jgi:HIV Tat-specific factor 1